MPVLVVGLQSTSAVHIRAVAPAEPPATGPQRRAQVETHPRWRTLTLAGPTPGATRHLPDVRQLGESAAVLERELQRVRPELVALFGVASDLRGQDGLHELGTSATLFEADLARTLGSGPSAHPDLVRGLATLGRRLQVRPDELVSASQVRPILGTLFTWADTMNACILFIHVPRSSIERSSGRAALAMIERLEAELREDQQEIQDWTLPGIR